MFISFKRRVNPLVLLCFIALGFSGLTGCKNQELDLLRKRLAKLEADQKKKKQQNQARPAPNRTASTSRPAPRNSQARLAQLEKEKKVKAALLQKRFMELRRRTLKPEGGLVYKHKLLQPHEVRRTLKIEGQVEALFLQGTPRTPNYDAIQYTRPLGAKHNGLYFALQVWKNTPKKLSALWKLHQATYPAVKPFAKAPVGTSAFQAFRSPYRYYHFIASKTPVMLSLTCHESLCKDNSLLVELAKIIDQRLR